MMRFALLTMSLFYAFPAVVRGCEGECIVGITNAFLSNYTYPIAAVFHQMNDELMTGIHSNAHSDARYTSPPKFLMEPFISAYNKDAYTPLETAIFPNKFHGKCLWPAANNPATLVTPPGCPNPDCPVVCGTPGSLVHFYRELRYIVYNTTRVHLQTLATPGSKPYAEVEKTFIREAIGGSTSAHRRDLGMRGGTMMPRMWVQEQAVKNKFQAMMRQLSSRLEKKCGGTGTGKLNGLQKCSWETRMKEFILSFP